MPYFEKRTNDEGVEELVEVDFAEMTIPDEVVFAHPKVKEITKRDIKRRNELKKLKAAKPVVEEVNEDDEDEVDTTEGTTTQQTVTPPPVINEDELFEKFTQRLTAAQQKIKDDQAAEEASLNALIEAHSLTPDAINILANTLPAQRQAQAVLLEKAGFRFDDADGGEVFGDKDDGELGSFMGASFKGVAKRLNLEGTQKENK